MTFFDYFIVGHGIAGSILSYQLQKKGKRLLVIDQFNFNSSSQVAAGIVNPITGRRVVKSWMADVLIPFAENFYREVAMESGKTFFHSMDVLEIINNVKDLNEWTSRTGDPGLNKYISTDAPENTFRNKLTDFKKIIRIKSSGWMDIPGFIEFNREKLIGSSGYLDEKFDINKLVINPGEIAYLNYKSRGIIFCEGYNTHLNPLWKGIPFLPAKGEILTIKCELLPEDFILMSGLFIVPIGNHLFRAGATYEWNFKDELPSENGRQKLTAQLKELLKIPFEITGHSSGVRPTIQDRRPVIGRHKQYENVFIFNGLGTKGVLLAPYFANHFVNYLHYEEALINEIDIKRFY
jgi:glycine oxidase